MKTDDPFEQLLAKQALRPVPPEWRAPILAVAAKVSRPVSTPGGFWDLVKFLFCPPPRLAACLAAAWVLIGCLNSLSLPPGSRLVGQGMSPPSAVTRMAWLEQQRLREELLSEEALAPLTPPSPAQPATRPRSARPSQIQVC